MVPSTQIPQRRIARRRTPGWLEAFAFVGAEGAVGGGPLFPPRLAAADAGAGRAAVEVDVAPARLIEDASGGRFARAVLAAHP